MWENSCPSLPLLLLSVLFVCCGVGAALSHLGWSALLFLSIISSAVHRLLQHAFPCPRISCCSCNGRSAERQWQRRRKTEGYSSAAGCANSSGDLNCERWGNDLG